MDTPTGPTRPAAATLRSGVVAPPLNIAGVDLPLPGPAAEAPLEPDQAVRRIGRATAAVTDQPPAVMAHVDKQHRVRCRDLIEKMTWGPSTPLVAWTDLHAPIAWLQALLEPCPHDDCNHDHTPPALPGDPRQLTDDRACVTSDSRRLKVIPGICQAVGARAGQDLLVIAQPALRAVLITSPAAASAALLHLLAAAQNGAEGSARATNEVTHIHDDTRKAV